MDFKLAEKSFQEYLKNYDTNDGSISLKYNILMKLLKKVNI